MNSYIEIIVIISLVCTGLHTVFSDSQVLSPIRAKAANYLDKWFGKTTSKYIQKPIWDCLPCMASVWTIIITQSIDVWLILAVCGLNVIIDRLIFNETDYAAAD